MIERYRRWYLYEREAHERVVRSLEVLPGERRRTPEFEKAVGLLAHLARARRLWLHRFGEPVDPPGDFFPGGLALEDAVAEHRAVEALWARYLERVTDADLDRVFDYRALDGTPFRNRVEDILTQLFGHSWYHRGQIAQLVRGLGGDPAVTDFVYWCREARPGTEG
jgi:uncharacterized damage-inducible protein DinB